MISFFANLSEKSARIFVFLFACVVIFCGLGAGELLSGDELRVAGISLQTAAEHNYLIPMLNGYPFLEYPPLFYWIESVIFSFLGVSTFTARLLTAITALASTCLVFEFALKLKYRPYSAMASSVFFLASTQYLMNCRKNRVDVLLCLFILAALFCFYCLVHSEQLGKKILLGFCFALALTGGAYTKGIIGIAFPLLVAAVWLLVEDIRKKGISIKHYVFITCATVISGFLLSVWYYKIHQASSEMLEEALLTNNLGRVSGAQGDHMGKFFYYLINFYSLFQPYLILLLIGMYLMVRNFKKLDSDRLFLFVYLLVPFLFFQFFAAKRIIYLLPLTVPAALISADVLQQIPASWFEWSKRHIILSRIPLQLLVVALAVALVIFTFFLPASLKFITIPGIAACVLFSLFRKKPELQFYLWMTAGALFCVSILGITQDKEDKNLKPLFEFCRQEEEKGKQIIIITDSERTHGGAYYYLRHTLPYLTEEEANKIPNAYILTRDKHRKDSALVFADHHILIPTNPEAAANAE